MVTCPACGKENEDAALECRRCRAPLREEEPPAAAASGALGEVCRRCETFNEPGVTACTNCGEALFADPAPAWQPPPENASMSQELRALALSDEEAAEAGVSTAGNGHASFDITPAEPFSPPPPVEPPPVATGRARVGAPSGAMLGGAAAASIRREPPPPPAAPARAPEPPAAPLEKPCGSCGALNPPAAKFCFDCGTPFAKKSAPPNPEPPPSIQVDASMQEEIALAEDFGDATAESAPVMEEEAVPAESVGEPILEEQPPPFSVTVVVEKGQAQGSAFTLAHMENTLGATGTNIELGDDAFVAPLAATLAFVEDRLVLRDEGTVNGVYVKVRESVPLEPGDMFVAGEHLLRYDGPVELPAPAGGDTPCLGGPRPQGAALRVVELLAGGRIGRTCHRGGPVIAIGRSGCDINFSSDSQLAARHAEIRIGEDGGAALVDLGQGPSGVFVRVRQQQHIDLTGGDMVQVGDQLLRVELG